MYRHHIFTGMAICKNNTKTHFFTLLEVKLEAKAICTCDKTVQIFLEAVRYFYSLWSMWNTSNTCDRHSRRANIHVTILSYDYAVLCSLISVYYGAHFNVGKVLYSGIFFQI